MRRFKLRAHDEDGVALVTALLAVIILSGLVIVFFNRAVTEMRVSGDARNFETAVHAAEAASDNQIRALNSDDDHVTDDNTGNPVTLEELDEFAGTEREWVLEQIERFEDVEGVWITSSRGEAFAFRPTEDDEPTNVLYAAGAIPSFDEDSRNRVRVLKMQIAQDHWVPEHALLTGGDLDVGGSGSIVVDGCDDSTPESAELTCIADVHTNEDLKWQGNAAEIQGQITVANGSCPTFPSGTVTGGCLDANDGVAPKPIPPFTARSFYRPPTEESIDEDTPAEGLNPDPAGDTMAWYDLCGDETVRAPNPDGEPCTGTLLWPDTEADKQSDFRGWEYGTKANNTGWHATSARAGVYYVHGADAFVSGTGNELRALTIIVDDAGDPSGAGSLRVTGNPRFRPGMEDVLFVADRDFNASGTGGAGNSSDPCGMDSTEAQDFGGFIGAGEQIRVHGNVRLAGAMVARDSADEHDEVTPDTSISGNMCLDYNFDLEVDLSGIWVITFWNEL